MTAADLYLIGTPVVQSMLIQTTSHFAPGIVDS
jgi:hypothetical protein